MRKWITLLMTCLVAGSFSYANATGQVNLEAGYRRDNISWKHRYPSNDPMVSSSHRFKDLDIFQIGINGRATLGANFYGRANAYWGWILDGDFKKSASAYFDNHPNYGYDDGVRFGASDHDRTVIDDKYVYGIGAAIGYPFYFCDCTTVVAPVIGYAFDEQSIQLETKGFNLHDRDGCSVNRGDCCRKTFNSRWYGPFVGVDFNYRPYNECWNLYADLEYHWGCFRGRRSSTDRLDLFDHNNRSSHEARGWVFAAGADYDLSNAWTVGLSVKFQDWSASRHHRVSLDSGDADIIYCDSKDEHSRDRQRTNHKWHSYAINVTVGKEF